jgi:nitroreductase
MGLETVEAIRTRRVTRFFQERIIAEETLWQVLEAARWAPAGSGRRVQRYVCVTDRNLIRQIKMMAPGIAGNLPAALIVICVDWNQAGYEAVDEVRARLLTYIDVGTAAQNMMLAAHSLGLGAGPVTAFSPDAVDEFLNLPGGWRAEMFVTLGYRGETPSSLWQLPKVRISVEDLVQWGPFPSERARTNDI